MVFLFMTIIHFRNLTGLITYVAFVELTVFFDTIKVGPLGLQLMDENINYLVVRFIANLYTNIWAEVKTAALHMEYMQMIKPK